MKKSKFMVVAIILILISGCRHLTPNKPTENPAKIKIIHINDTHSHLEPYFNNLMINNIKTSFPLGGFPHILFKIKSIKKDNPNSLVLHAGDAFQGTLYFTKYKGLADLKFLNKMSIDAMVTGNHEFDIDSKTLYNYINKAEFPLLAANIDVSKDKYLKGLIKPYIIKEINGHKYGIIGLITKGTVFISNPDESIKFNDEKKSLIKTINQLKEKNINKIIVLSHIGYLNDIDIAKQVKDIDIIVGGHSHTLLGDFKKFGLESEGSYPTVKKDPAGNKVCIVQSWEWAKVIGVLDIYFNKNGTVKSCTGKPFIPVSSQISRENKEGKWYRLKDKEKEEVIKIVNKLSGISFIEPDNESLELLKGFTSSINDLKTTIIAKVIDDLPHIRQPWAKHYTTGKKLIKGSFVAPLVTKSMLWKAYQVGFHVDIAVQNAGNIRTDLNAGDLAVDKVYELLPFENTLVALKLKGSEILESLEKAMSLGSAAYPYLSGARIKIDKNRPNGKFIVKLELNMGQDKWKIIDENKEYSIITNSFIANGGDLYDLFKKAKSTHNDLGFITAEIFMEYVSALKEVRPVKNTGITCLNCE